MTQIDKADADHRRKLLEDSHPPGLTVLDCRYLVSLNLFVVDFEQLRPAIVHYPLMAISSWSAKLAWMLQRAGLRLPAHRYTAPYVFCLASKSALRG
ncbi:MAG: hypothetical protein HQ502_17780 [Alphaproteobacteria bacterium]|nr:hypothetical protein [Alphaproteobacteria bacterium]